uniref:Uncharacterized protein n=1 Tax=Aegilops tauschii subsp. strangulata TaxID=200361 RepID=A0A453LYF7_AEGTS
GSEAPQTKKKANEKCSSEAPSHPHPPVPLPLASLPPEPRPQARVPYAAAGVSPPHHTRISPFHPHLRSSIAISRSEKRGPPHRLPPPPTSEAPY